MFGEVVIDFRATFGEAVCDGELGEETLVGGETGGGEDAGGLGLLYESSEMAVGTRGTGRAAIN